MKLNFRVEKGRRIVGTYLLTISNGVRSKLLLGEPNLYLLYAFFLFFRFCSGRHKRKKPPARSMPSRWYTLLALPFPDQQVGRREFSRAYRSRAGYFSNPI